MACYNLLSLKGTLGTLLITVDLAIMCPCDDIIKACDGRDMGHDQR